jgi:hypothetical protein
MRCFLPEHFLLWNRGSAWDLTHPTKKPIHLIP